MKRRWLIRHAGIHAASLLSTAAVASTSARPAHAAGHSVDRGAVIALKGSAHLWIADGAKRFHWAGDTRALDGRFVDWGTRTEITIYEVLDLDLGDPWLSTGFVKLGTSVYLARWQTDEPAPTLLHVPTPQDLQAFGITDTNYGEFVLEQATWEARYGLKTNGLARGDLPSVFPTLEELLPSGPRIKPNLDMLFPAGQMEGSAESVIDHVDDTSARRTVQFKGGPIVGQDVTLYASAVQALNVIAGRVEIKRQERWTVLPAVQLGSATAIALRAPDSAGTGYAIVHALKGAYVCSALVLGTRSFEGARDLALRVVTGIVSRLPG